MKVLALNGSPRMKASSTYHIMKPFLEGMEAAGAETEVIHIRKLHLKHCIGCYTCWVRTPGVCIHKDSMTEALTKFNHADMVIFGTPLYHFSMSAVMKDFIDRTLPRIEPWLIPHSTVPGVTGHPERFHKPEKMFLISPCGFPEFEHFESLVATFKQMARMGNWQYVGELLRPSAEPLSRRSLQRLFTHYYELVRQAGEEVIRNGSISDELQAELRQDLFPGGKQAFYDMAAGYWTQQMDRFKVPQDQRHTVPILAADLDIVPMAPAGAEVQASGMAKIGGRYYVPNEEMMSYLAEMYNPQAIPGLRATIQFAFIPPKLAPSTGIKFDPGAPAWYMNIGDGKCTVHQGRTAVPTLTITTPHEVWQDIGSGLLDAETAFTEGKFEATGSMLLMQQFPQIFQYPQPGEGNGANPELDMIMMGMPLAFNAKAAADLEASIEFMLSGTGGGLYSLHIQDGKCSAQRLPVEKPTLTIHAPAEVWLAIAKGELDGQQAFMKGQYRATGDMSLMMKMNSLFDARLVTDESQSAIPQASASQTTIETTEKESTMIDLSTLNCRDTIAGMTTVFNPDVAGNLSADIQYRVTGSEPGTYYLHISNGECSFHEGESPAPTMTIHTPSDVWLAISRGEMDGQMAFMQGKYRAEGDFSLLMKMNQMFKRG